MRFVYISRLEWGAEDMVLLQHVCTPVKIVTKVQ